MIGNISIWIEEEVWREMANIADLMARNPKVKVGAELAQTRAHIHALKSERRHQLDSLQHKLEGHPDDDTARLQIMQGNERLADLDAAEEILTALEN